MTNDLVPFVKQELTQEQLKEARQGAFEFLAQIEPTIEWLTNIPTKETQRAYKTSVSSFMIFWGIQSSEQFNQVKLSHVIAWRNHLVNSGKTVSTVKARISALSDLFKHLAAAQLVKHNPVRDLKQKKLKRTTGTTPALSPKQARMVLDAPPDDTLQGLRDRAILAIGFSFRPPA